MQSRSDYADTGSVLSAMVVAVFAVLVLFVPTLLMPLLDVDEGAFSEATREMLRSGDYLTTYLQGALRFDKPILIYWLQALALQLFGLHAWSLRLPSVLSSCAWCLCVYAYVRQVYNTNQALWSVWFMLACVQLAIVARLAIADALLNLCLVATMLAIARLLQTKQQSWRFVAFVAMGLGMLTKGPIALLLPVLSVAVYAFSLRSFTVLLEVFACVRSWILWSVVALPWYGYAYYVHGQAFIQGFFLRHNLERAMLSLEQHHGGLGYYLPIVVFGMTPLTLFLWPLWQQRKRIWADLSQRFLLCWFGSTLLFFSLVATKLPHYVVYGYTPILMLMALYHQHYRNLAWLYGFNGFIILFMAALPMVVQWYMTHYSAAGWGDVVMLKAEIMQAFAWDYQLIMLVSAVVLLWMYLRVIDLQITVLGLSVVMMLVVHWQFVPRLAQVLQAPVKEAALLAKQKQWSVVMYRVHYPSFSVYREAITPRQLQPRSGEIVLTKERYLANFERVERLYSRAGLVLARVWWTQESSEIEN